MHGKAYDTKGSVLSSYIGQGKNYLDWNFARTETFARTLRYRTMYNVVEIGSNVDDNFIENAILNVSTSLQSKF